jgi:hypothetical protein
VSVTEWERCEIHGRLESFTRELHFKVCGACHHVWPTAQAFRDDVEAAGYPDRLPSCPLCSHDF